MTWDRDGEDGLAELAEECRMDRARACIATARDSQRYCTVALLGLMLTLGCRSDSPEPVTDPQLNEPAPATTVDPKPASKPAEPEPSVVAEPDPEPLRVAILLSDNRPQYARVGTALIQLAGPGNADLYPLDVDSGRLSAVVEAVHNGDYDRIVGVGLLAAQTCKSIDSHGAVFCQVINHREKQLLGDGIVGIHALPPLDEAVSTWKRIHPQLKRVGVISGAGHEATIAVAREAMAAHGVELVHKVTESDKETVYEFRRLVGRTQGYWLFPDNRVLSRSAFGELMSLARRARIQVLVNDDKFLDEGGLISASTSSQDIAERVFEALRGSASDSMDELIPLQRCNVAINGKLAAELGIELDASLQPLVAR